MQVKTLILSTFAAVGLTAIASAADIETVSSGNWSNEEIWDLERLPTSDDRVTIKHPVDVDIADAVAGVLLVEADLKVLAGKQLAIDGDYSGGSQDSSIGSGLTIDLEGTDSVLQFTGSTTLQGPGKVVGMNDNARIEIAADQTLTLAGGLTNMGVIEGHLKIQGLTGGDANGGFVNNGTLEANASGTLLVHAQTVLGAGSGDWKVTEDGAKLQFDAGSTSESGDFVISDDGQDDGEMEFNAAVSTSGKVSFRAGTMDVNQNFTTTLATDSFEYDGGTFEIASGKRFQYQDFDEANSSQSDPDDDPPADTDPPYEVVN